MKKEFDKNKNYNEILSKVERVNNMKNFKMKYMLAQKNNEVYMKKQFIQEKQIIIIMQYYIKIIKLEYNHLEIFELEQKNKQRLLKSLFIFIFHVYKIQIK